MHTFFFLWYQKYSVVEAYFELYGVPTFRGVGLIQEMCDRYEIIFEAKEFFCCLKI